MARFSRLHIPFLASPVLLLAAAAFVVQMFRTPGFDALGYMAGAIVVGTLALAAPGTAMLLRSRTRLTRPLVVLATLSGAVTALLGLYGVGVFFNELGGIGSLSLGEVPFLLFVAGATALGALCVVRGLRLLRAPLRHA